MELMNKMEREKLDCLKIFAMISVVLQHSMAVYVNWFRTPKINSEFYAFFNNYLSSYHIYIFIFVSGYLYFYTTYEIKKKETIIEFIIKKFKRLIIPYILISIFYVYPIRIITNKSYGLSLYNIVNDIFLSKNPSHLWFLLMLFWIFIIFRVLDERIKKYNKVVMLLTLYILFIVGKILNKFNLLNILQISNVIQYIIFFYAGFICRMKFKIIECKLNNIKISHLFIIQIILIFIKQFLNNNQSIIMQLIVVIMDPLIAFIGIALFYLIVNIILSLNENIVDSKIYLFLKYNNFNIYLLHMPIIQIILSVIYDKMISPTVLVLICFTISIWISSIISIILNKYKNITTLG